MTRLPDNFPPGTRFWLLTIDAFADASGDGYNQLLRADGAVVDGVAAETLRRRAAAEGVQITEAEFRRFAPTLFDRIAGVIDKVTTDPDLKRKVFEAIARAAPEQGNPLDEKICRDALRDSTNQKVRSFAAELLLELAARKQKRDTQ